MARPGTAEPQLPWVDQAEDRFFLWLSIALLVAMLAGGILLNLIKLPEIAQQQLADVSPRLAKLILEKRQIEQPKPKPEAPKPEPEKEQVKKEEPKKPEPEKVTPKPKSAREVAQSSGLIALQDELADLRESFALDDVIDAPQQTAGKQALQVASTSELLSASATSSSGGIRTDTLNRKIATSELAQRQTTRVESKIQGGDQVASIAPSRQAQGGGQRSPAEIERVFQKYKGSIFNLYNRALRKNPTLAGKFVVELTIAGDGSVTAVKVISSELGDKALERKLVLKIKQFKFASAGDAASVVRYPIDFLPS